LILTKAKYVLANYTAFPFPSNPKTIFLPTFAPMAGTVNKVILIGNVGKDPEVRYLENGAGVASLTLATSENYTDKKTGEKRTITDWHNIVLWRGLAEITKNYVKKGSKIYVEGKLRTRSYTDKDNIVRYITEIIADELQLLTPRAESADNQQASYPPSLEAKNEQPLPDSFMSDDDLPF
jgi:single-strand DNA-binding protein